MLHKIFPFYTGLLMLAVLCMPACANAATLYWYSTGVGAQTTQWDDVDNWWNDSDHSVQAGAIPGINDAVVLTASSSVYPVIDLDTWTEPASIDASLGDITFTSANDATYTRNITVGGTMHMRGSAIFDGHLVGQSNFHDTSMNTGTLEGLAKFYDTSRNHGTGHVQQSSVEFYDTSVNAGSADQNMTFYDSSYNDGISGGSGFSTVTFNDSSYNTGGVGGVVIYFNDNSHNDNTVSGDATFTFPAVNNGTVSGRATFTGGTYTLSSTFGSNGSTTLDNLHLSGTDSWSDQFPNTTVIDWYFTGSSTNDVTIERPGTETFTFEDNATNNAVITASSSVSFNDNTVNNSEVTAARIHFRDLSSNGLSGVLTATEEITFYGDNANNFGTQSAPTIRVSYSSNTITTRNFVTGGPWTVIANGATVNYCGATYNQTTTFSAVNGGAFASCSTSNNNNNSFIGPTGGSSGPVYIYRDDTPQHIPPTTPPLFTRTISLHTTHPEVKKLQKLLNDSGFIVSKKGLGSPGKETTTFGIKTYVALRKFQKANNLPITNRFDIRTLTFMNNLGK